MGCMRSIRAKAMVACVCACAAIAQLAFAAPSSRPGWGSIPYYTGGTGITFRVWAPNATSVNLAATFNGYSPTATPLFSNDVYGAWSVDVPLAAAAITNQQYKYYIPNRSPNAYAQ